MKYLLPVQNGPDVISENVLKFHFHGSDDVDVRERKFLMSDPFSMALSLPNVGHIPRLWDFRIFVAVKLMKQVWQPNYLSFQLLK